MSFLLTGCNGQLGVSVIKTTPADVNLICAGSNELDISEKTAVRDYVAKHNPSVIINAAAYTAVDMAEEEPELASAVNADGPRNLALAAEETGARVVHVSTDFVFDGQCSSPYSPTSITSPLGVYGQSKRDGEQSVLEILPDQGLVVRTSWLYSAVGRNFVLTMLGRMRDGAALRVVADQRGSPTWAESLAATLWKFVFAPGLSGIYHYSDAGEVSWHEFAMAIQEESLSLGLIERKVPIEAISTEDFPTAASRPAYSVLDCSETHAALCTQPVHWRHNLREMLNQLRN